MTALSAVSFELSASILVYNDKESTYEVANDRRRGRTCTEHALLGGDGRGCVTGTPGVGPCEIPGGIDAAAGRVREAFQNGRERYGEVSAARRAGDLARHR